MRLATGMAGNGFAGVGEIKKIQLSTVVIVLLNLLGFGFGFGFGFGHDWRLPVVHLPQLVIAHHLV